jgi:diacylglycerol kinase family enzyme
LLSTVIDQLKKLDKQEVGQDEIAAAAGEAEGEFLGDLPVRIEIAPQAVTLLIPPNVKP